MEKNKVLSPQDCIKKYGLPTPEMERKYMTMWNIPEDVCNLIHTIPRKLYCNNDLRIPLLKALRNVISRKLIDEIKTWDGCFCIRYQRNSVIPSIHSWGLAIDINASENHLGNSPKISPELVKCFTDSGFDWGGNFKGNRVDGMHFQLHEI